ncbi:MAG TPA: M23 family metallopeptidase [Allosphingosinicella sp.]|nr:M23 family metallopeptidase [Allosphingosinicella sp.]
MARPDLKVDILPSQDGKVYYLPLAPQSRDHEERLKIAVRLKITHQDADHPQLTITRIVFSYPGTGLDEREMLRVPQYIHPDGGVLALGDTATWSNGSVKLANKDKAYNQVYLDRPAPQRLRISVHCAETDAPWSDLFDLIPWRPVSERALLLPFALVDLADDEYIVTSARHWYNGQHNGTQIYAHDISIQARVNGEWTRTYSGTATRNRDIRVFGRPVRAMGDGEVLDVVQQGPDNPYDKELAAAAANYVWVRYGTLDVKYSHLREDSIAVSPGRRVRAGQKLAEAGNSGNTGGSPHLHMECRTHSGHTLRGFVFRNTWQLARDLVPADGGRGRRVQIDRQGICEETAALRPFATWFGPGDLGLEIDELEVLVAEIFGGAAKGGEGWVIVNGRLIRVPPRGIKGELLKAIVALGEAEALGGAAASKRVKAILDALDEALKAGR